MKYDYKETTVTVENVTELHETTSKLLDTAACSPPFLRQPRSLKVPHIEAHVRRQR